MRHSADGQRGSLRRARRAVPNRLPTAEGPGALQGTPGRPGLPSGSPLSHVDPFEAVA
jgi:hypothetical protein